MRKINLIKKTEILHYFFCPFFQPHACHVLRFCCKWMMDNCLPKVLHHIFCAEEDESSQKLKTFIYCKNNMSMMYYIGKHAISTNGTLNQM